MIVLDASVILKWFIYEEDSDIARIFLDEHCAGRESIAVPSLLFLEITNVLVSNRKIPGTEIKDALRRLCMLRLTICDLGEDDLARSIELAMNHHITVYDCCYLSVAEKFNCAMITADRRLLQRIGDLRYAHLLDKESIRPDRRF